MVHDILLILLITNVVINYEKGNGKLILEDEDKSIEMTIHLSCHYLVPK